MESEYKEYLHLTAAMAAQTPQNTSATNNFLLFVALVYNCLTCMQAINILPR